MTFTEFNDMAINAVVLSAGLSERFKGPNKLLANINGQSVISKTYQSISQSSIIQSVVVTGRDEEIVKDSVKMNQIDFFIHNESFESGMTSSIQTGLNKLLESDAIMVCLGDMPWLEPSDYDLLLNEFKKIGDKDRILVPWFGDKRANPVIFGNAFFKEILDHKAPNGCAGIIKAHPNKILNLKVDSERFIRDIDTPEDLQRLIKDA